MKRLLIIILLAFAFKVQAQPKEIKLSLDTNGSYIKMTFLNQVWARWNESNSGTLVNSQPAVQTFDIGLRRTRMQAFGRIGSRVFFYTQFGLNNFNYLSHQNGNRKIHAFFHDAVSEYFVFDNKEYLKLGGGLTIANGLSRFSQPSIGTIMSLDVPVFAQATVDQTDQFSRKLSLYARGQVGKLDYRLVLSDPFPVQTNGVPPAALSQYASFTTKGHRKQFQTLLIYFLGDKESNTTPYMTGTYLGKKRIINLESGLIYQPDATWRETASGDTVFDNMLLWSVAAFADIPIKETGNCLNFYSGYFRTEYGRGYLRNNGIMNPANGGAALVSSGFGNAYPMFGTGQVLYIQTGYKFKPFKNLGAVMPYASVQNAWYDRLQDPVSVFDIGVNYFIQDHYSKLSLDFQSRPEYNLNYDITRRRSSVILQFQIFI